MWSPSRSRADQNSTPPPLPRRLFARTARRSPARPGRPANADPGESHDPSKPGPEAREHHHPPLAPPPAAAPATLRRLRRAARNLAPPAALQIHEPTDRASRPARPARLPPRRCVAAAPAGADDAVAELAADTPLSAYGGALAWSDYDAASERFALVIRQGDATAAAPIATARRAFDVSLGPDARGRVVALYTRCRVAPRGRTAERGCDVYRYDLRTRRERKLASVSSPKLDEAWPAQWRGRIAFARRARAHTIDGYDHRPDPRGRGPLMDCDIPYVKTLASRAASRRLDRSQCGATTGTAIRGETIVVTTDINQGGAGSESQVRRLRTGGGAARILQRTRGGEGGYSPFVAPSLSSSAVWLTRTGRREGVQQGFLRIDLQSARLTTVPANLNFTGSIARDERGALLVRPGTGAGLRLRAVVRLRARALPARSRLRQPVLLDAAHAAAARLDRRAARTSSWRSPPIRRCWRATSAGRSCARARSSAASRVAGRRADAAAHRRRSSSPGRSAATGLTATTDANGRWSLQLHDAAAADRARRPGAGAEDRKPRRAGHLVVADDAGRERPLAERDGCARASPGAASRSSD